MLLPTAATSSLFTVAAAREASKYYLSHDSLLLLGLHQIARLVAHNYMHAGVDRDKKRARGHGGLWNQRNFDFL